MSEAKRCIDIGAMNSCKCMHVVITQISAQTLITVYEPNVFLLF